MHNEDEVYEIEVVDGELVTRPQEIGPVDTDRLPVWAPPPTMQLAVAAATGFVAGAATLALLRRYGPSRAEGPSLGRDLLPVGFVRSYVIHVRPLRPYVE